MSLTTYYSVAEVEGLNTPCEVHRVCIHCEDETFFMMTKEQYNKWQIRGMFVQDVFPHLSSEIREWMISGTHPHCWNEIFPEEDFD